ncbi:hypothetical protein PENSPDRAFT_737582 [Peniophora sp. CONT]|nr:hypothetical protein PENSPDRAFT_737582 [Peniophora sp. CONT]
MLNASSFLCASLSPTTTMNFPASSSARPHHDEQAVYGDEPRGRRDSNALRASVLDVAMQLGIGSSRTLQNWMFDAVDEEDEGDPDDDDLVSSGQRPQLGRFKSIYREEFDAATLSSGVLDAITKHPGGIRMPPPPIPDSPPKTQSRFRNKLRKGRKSDEMEPDTGYLSEGGAAAKRRVHKAKRAAMRSSEDQTDDEGYISEATKKRRPFFRNMFGDKQKEMPPISTPQPLAAPIAIAIPIPESISTPTATAYVRLARVVPGTLAALAGAQFDAHVRNEPIVRAA